MARPKAVDQLDALYVRLPQLQCKGLCQDACGPIVMTDAEWDRIAEARGGKMPREPEASTCPLLEAGRCSVYAVRPLICRMWGVARPMICPHGCRPHRKLSRGEGRRFLKAAEKIGGAGWRTLHPGLSAALAQVYGLNLRGVR